ncbi:hypothetical protein D3876_15645 [Sphingomonas cavernae]|uniref:Uncharacterized protein n=2 Tax=Sphingomonas cavernae TaxID=2320861 RepID=A0A418W5Q6_9SPHN|nr:hypothetical protein D3876_15645 [Sphingomonas cavernae]
MNSVQYLAMANLVIETDEFRRYPRKNNRPILNTLAVGIELLLKFAHVHCGSTVEAVASRYRHNIWKLWQECPDPALTHLVLEAAERSYASALAQGLVNEPIADLPEQFCEAVRNLSTLHNTGGSQLRYLAPAGVMATAPGWLTQAFYSVADACLRRPPFGQ